MLDFEKLHRGEISLEQLCQDLTIQDLHSLTDEMINTMFNLIQGAMDEDVTFIPLDPEADDPFAANEEEKYIAWTLAHVIVHCTASAEEAASQATWLARGVQVCGRSRYEVPWETVKTIVQLHQRLAESRRMRHASLDTWPDNPHLDVTYMADYPGAKPRNAIQRFIAGLSHDYSHLGQIQNIMQQAHTARTCKT